MFPRLDRSVVAATRSADNADKEASTLLRTTAPFELGERFECSAEDGHAAMPESGG